MSRLAFAVSSMLLSAVAVGQISPQPGAGPTLAAPPRTVAVPSTQPGQQDMVPMQFPNADVKEVLSFYERLITQQAREDARREGRDVPQPKTLVYDNQVVGTISLVVSEPVRLQDAIKIIEINLLLNGFTLVPVENSDIVKVIGIGKNPRAAAIPLISDEMLLPEGEHVVTFLSKIKYADPTELAQVLGSYVVPAQGQYTNITPLPKASALLITENTATIRQVLRIIREIDVPPAEVGSKFFELSNAIAEDVQKQLDEMLNKQNQQGATGNAGIRPAPAPRIATTPDGQPLPPGTNPADAAASTIEITAGGPNEESIIAGKIKITADKRTNRLHVVTRPANMPFIEKLIREFDANVAFGTPISRPLKYVKATDILQAVVKAISDPGAKEDAGAAGGSRNGRQSQQTNNNSNGSLFGNNGNQGGSFGGDSGGSGGTGFNVSEGLSTDAVDTTPQAVTVGNTRIIADPRTNSIIVVGSEDVKDKLFRVIAELDKRPPQVMFHVVIGELNLSDREQFGVDYIIRNAGLGMSPIVLSGGNGTGGTTTGGTTTGGTTTGGTTTGGTTGSTGTGGATDLVSINGTQPVLNFNNLLNQNKIKQIATAGGSGLSGFVAGGNTLTAIITALENTNRFRVVSRPSVFTSNLKKAIIASGQEIAVPTSIQSSVNAVSNNNAGLVTNSSVQFKRVALQLEVVPLINSDREVDLDILQKNDEVSGSTRIDNNDIPTIATRYVKTHVTVPNQATLVLGGLIKASTNRVRSGIPLLSSIPVIGYLFSNTTKERVRQELVILIRPEVSWTPEEDVATREKHQEFYNMPPDLEATVYPTTTRSRTDPEPKIPVRRAIPISKPKRAAFRDPIPPERIEDPVTVERTETVIRRTESK
jgi:general secretion pathway protein D